MNNSQLHKVLRRRLKMENIDLDIFNSLYSNFNQREK